MQGHNNTYEERNQNEDGTPKPNEAEIEFERLAKDRQWFMHRIGFDEKKNPVPSITFHKIPKSLRSAPDYFIVYDIKQFCFFEIKGFIDEFKIKKSDIGVYNSWQKNHENTMVAIFAWDKGTNKSYTIRLNRINDGIESGELKIGGVFDNKKSKEYYAIPLDICHPMK